MTAAGQYRVTIAGQPAASQILSPGQARGEACVRCAVPGPDLLPVGVATPLAGSGIIVACPACVPAVLAIRRPRTPGI